MYTHCSFVDTIFSCVTLTVTLVLLTVCTTVAVTFLSTSSPLHLCLINDEYLAAASAFPRLLMAFLSS